MNITGNPILTSSPIASYIVSSDNEPLDLDIPIAIRKRVQKCINHPITKYLSYKRLSNNHRTFTTKISHLFVSRNIQETLDDPNWKLAIMI